jgi:uncharacterized protein YbcV (DUF1398 family)
MSLGAPLVSATVDVSRFDREALIAAATTDQAGQSIFPEFLLASSHAGVVRYYRFYCAYIAIYELLTHP